MITILAGSGLGMVALPFLLRRLGRRLQPGHWSALCAIALAGGTVLVVGAGLLASLSTALRVVGLPRAARSCDAMFGHLVPSGSPLALAALGVTLSVLALGFRALYCFHQDVKRSWVEPGIGSRLRRDGPFEVVVLDDSRRRALCVPATSGRRSQVLLTTGLIDALPPAQLDVVCAHEEAHIRLAHGSFRALASAVEQGMWFWPPAKASAKALRLSLERWADETATGSAPLARACLRSALLSVAIDEQHSALAAFSVLDGLVERLSAMSGPAQANQARVWWPVLLSPGLLLGALAVFAMSRLGHDAYCIVSMAAGCGLR